MKMELEDLAPIEGMMRQVVREELKMVVLKPESDPEIMDVRGLCEYLGVTPKWVHERTHLKQIPFHKLSSKVLRFRRRDIDKWLETLKVYAAHDFKGRALRSVNG